MSLAEFNPRFFSHESAGADGDTTVVRIDESHLTEEQNIEQFGLELMSLVDQYRCGKIVLNVGEIEYATSAAIGKIIMLHRKVRRGEGRMVICCVGDELGEVLRTSRLNNYFEIVDDEPAAIDALSSD